MEIKIVKMLIENFKKIKHLEVELDGLNTIISGKNGSGKSTVFDAFSWCLFGKDSLGRTNFDIKYINPVTKEVTHYIEPTVELTLDVDGGTVILKRGWKERWSKKRGSEELELVGHDTLCWVNGVPKNVTEYKKEIDNLISEDLFRMVTNVNSFTSLKEKEQRDIIFKLASDISDEEIINANPELKELKAHLILGRTVDDVEAIAKADKKKASDQKKLIPNSIKTLMETEYKSLSNDYDDKRNDEEIAAKETKLSKLKADKASGNTDSEIAKFEQSLAEMSLSVRKLEHEREELASKAEYENVKMIRDKKTEIVEFEGKIARLEADKSTLERRITDGNKAIEEEKVKKDFVYVEYDHVNDESFVAENCAYCGQALPQDKLSELEAKFNANKSERLESIIAKGQECNANIEKYEKAVAHFEKDLEELDVKIEAKNSDLELLKQEIKILDAKVVEVDTSKVDAEIEKINNRIEVTRKTVEKLRNKSGVDIYSGAIHELENDISLLKDKKAEYQLKLQNDARIKKYEEELKLQNINYEDAEARINLCSEFTKIKADYLSDKINANFEIVKFKLFNILMNGITEDTCVATYNDIPYPTCSNGEKINIGLDIIKTLQRIYGVKAPIFIDNAESVSDWLVNMDCQMLKMYVIENEELLIELEGGMENE